MKKIITPLEDFLNAEEYCENEKEDNSPSGELELP